MWFDGNRVLTYNALFNFIVGNRGTGKTYWAKKWAVADFLKNKKEFVYLRRYKTEIDVKTFFTQIQPEFPDTELTVKGKDFYIDGSYAGQAVALSTGITKKSMPFDNVNKIIFDEFMIENGNYRYLVNEVNKFLDFYETVNRLRVDGRADTIVFFLSNALSLYNPYFNFFKIKFRGNTKKFRNGELYAEIFLDEEFAKAKMESRFGKIISGTEYAEYAVFNNFYLDDNKLIGKKTGNAEYHCTFIINGKEYGIYRDYSVGKMFVTDSVDKTCPKRYCFSNKDHEINTMLIKGRSPYIKSFAENYKLGNVLYESQGVKSATQDTIVLFL